MLTADDLNARLPMPPDTWALDFRPSHALAARIGDRERQITQGALGPAFTLVHRGQIAALWGLVSPWGGLAEAWMVGDAAALQEIALPFTRGARRFLELAHERLALRRIQVHVPIANAAYVRWSVAAGFEIEAPLPCFLDDGGDVVLMARTWR